MKIYTYYEDINFKEQKDMLLLWHESWERKGFEPIVLGLQDAKKSPRYSDFCQKMQFIFKKITGKDLGRYGLSCFVRWLAYSTVENKEERFFVSDYDVVNSGKWETHHPVTNKLHLYDSACPCFASGNPQEFGQLCDGFFDVSMQRIDFLQKHANHYHDQEFFMYNFTPHQNPDSLKLWIKYNVHMSRNRQTDVSPYHPNQDQKNVRAFHISHHNTDIVSKSNLEHYQGYSSDQLRIQLMKDAFN